MLETLVRCYEYENDPGREPCGFDDVKHSLAALVNRGLIRTGSKKVGDKQVAGFFITEAGLTLLQKKNKQS